MDIENEIFALTTESLAFTAVLASVLGNIANTSPEMRTAIAGGFSDAASFVEHVAIMHGTRASPFKRSRPFRLSRNYARPRCATRLKHIG